MLTYYCKNCNNIIGKWNNEYEYYKIITYCNFTNSTNIPIKFLDCEHCNKFVGILCYNVCENCFGGNQKLGEENLFNWFLKYRKIIDFNYYCKICGKENFRLQRWLFEELTFYK